MAFAKKRIKQLRKKVRNVKRRTKFRRRFASLEGLENIRNYNERVARRAIIISEEIMAYSKKLPSNISRKLREWIVMLGDEESAGGAAEYIRDWIRKARQSGNKRELNMIRKYAKPALILCKKHSRYYIRVPAQEALHLLRLIENDKNRL